MIQVNCFSQRHAALLKGTYDCVDRIVLNGYFIFGQSPGGFRCWWRQMFGSDDKLNNSSLMRLAGRFSRRLRAAAKQRKIPVIPVKSKDRIHEEAERLRPADRGFRGVFCITVHRAPNSVWEVQEYGKGGKELRRKNPQPYVNHYAFHIQDPDWGHVTIKVCGHAPFNVQAIFNGHEYVACQAARRKIGLTMEGNCFTRTSELAGLSKIAETTHASGVKGRLRQVCERWVYSACLCYVLDVADQKRTRFRYDWSVYQGEYSHNLWFTSGRAMEELFQTMIDRTRRALDLKTIKMLFGRKGRSPQGPDSDEPKIEVVIERPAYNLIVLRVHFGLLTLKMYTKGDHVLRIEAIVHNAKKEFARGYGLDKFPQILHALRSMIGRFLGVMGSVDSCWITDATWETLPEPSQVGCAQVAGVDMNRARMRAVIQGVLALSTCRDGFRVEQLAARVRELMGRPYSARQASYDLKKLRGKDLVRKIPNTRRYESSGDGLRTMAALVVLREKVIRPILAGARQARRRQPCRVKRNLDHHYENIQYDLEKLFQVLGIAA